MERLSKRNEDGSVGISNCRYYNYDDFQKIASKLADYEDAEEQGLLLRLPCKVGTTVYVIIEEWEEMGYYDIYEEKFHLNMLESVEEYIFLTREEAEKALADMGV